jgi:hypothetical protein
MICHMVMFRLKHAHGSLQEKAFLRDSRTALADLPGVHKFELLKQVNPDNTFRFALSMEFADKPAYDAYDRHPRHTAYIHDRWNREVDSYLVCDYEVL